ncbi:unnamed protein product [Clonostachys solani]|uniref:Zn(2)-C6 fungal-type domain-containing protein n=1 Tax=Clonostachys solani TaxID=160281 RepID=A0A9P0ELP8_9HYPO|nr:unnamed protein product [Clonostachys solani]
MPPRLGFRKSRNGCLKCKERRVKCDEQLPCSACVRHGIECSLVASRSQSEMRGDLSMVSPSESPQPPLESDPFSVFDSSAAKLHGQEPDVVQWRVDLELMHHLTSVTWNTLPKGPGRQEIWQVALPRLALEQGNEFVLHQLLAVAAYHMAFLYPDDHVRHAVRASQHQDSAIQGLRTAVANINENNCHAIFATASILTISAFASHSTGMAQDLGPPTLDSLIEVFSLVRGVHRILNSWEDYIFRGPLGQLLDLGSHDSESPLLSTVLRELEEFAASNSPHFGAHSLITCIKFANLKGYDSELRVVNMWATYWSHEFFNSLCTREVPAMEALNYYVRIFEAVESNHWYLNGWSSGVRRDIEMTK